MNSKGAIFMKIVIMVLVSTVFIFYIISTASEYWQETKYKVKLHSVEILTGSHSQKEDSRVIKDLYRFTSSHSGLWRGCATLNNKKYCDSLRVLFAWLRAVRAFMALAIISITVVVVFVIATFFRIDLVFKFPGVMSMVSALFGILALAVYTGKSGVPANTFQYTSVYSWSFILAWVGWVLNVIVAIMCFLVPDTFEKLQGTKTIQA